MTRIPLIAGNWKMNLDYKQAQALIEDLNDNLKDAKHDFSAVEVAVLPPFVDIRTVQTVIDADKSGIVYGGQDVSEHESGAYTGEVSAAMLKALGAKYVAVGHSERRQYHAESGQQINAKVKAALAKDLSPILCVGEPLEQRKAGNHVPFTLEQVEAAIADLSADAVKNIVIAYEPVWAIGTGEVATAEDAQEVCAAIRSQIADKYSQEVADAIRILYGGSVKSSSIVELMAQADVDGALVGGASLQADEFAKIAGFYAA